MSKGSIKDPSIKIKPSQKLIAFIETLADEDELPENIWKFVEIAGRKSGKINIEEVAKPVFSKEEVDILNNLPKIDGTDFSLANFDISYDDDDDDCLDENIKNKKHQKGKKRAKLTINLNDIKWLNKKLTEKRNLDADFNLYLNELLTGSCLVLPKNEMLVRDPVLEARCVRLRLEQEARVYNAMTKNVDSSRTKLPDDTISYQIKQINRQLIAVVQFIVSIAAGFAFGFIGVELMVGDLDFGFRLLLGILCALIIALAEIYFLAKQLNQDYEASLPPKVNVSVSQVVNESGVKQINRQLIAVVQFIVSIAAGFAFGFIGVELMVDGDLDFGFRLLLGTLCALIIALAEIYFLAEKLNEDEDYEAFLPPKLNYSVSQIVNESGGKEHWE